MINYDWSVLICQCHYEKAKAFLVEIYRYIEYLAGVKGLHFTIRDRVGNDVVFSFRILLDPEEKRNIEDAITLKLRNTLPKDCYVINPKSDHFLYECAAWLWKDRIKLDGQEKFTIFYSYLNQLSKIVVEMAEKDYFSSEERVELTHFSASMLGFTEYALLSPKEMQIGYYDRINNSYHHHLALPFKKK